jgi:hypothetical protein
MASSIEAVSTPALADHPVRAALLLGALGVVFGDIGSRCAGCAQPDPSGGKSG